MRAWLAVAVGCALATGAALAHVGYFGTTFTQGGTQVAALGFFDDEDVDTALVGRGRAARAGRAAPRRRRAGPAKAVTPERAGRGGERGVEPVGARSRAICYRGGIVSISRVGFVGWRGMVGSVLLERMQAERDFAGLEPVFYSTSQVGLPAPDVGVDAPPLADAYDDALLAGHEVIVSCQGGDYTKQVLPRLRERGWQGYWIDAASAKRMDDDSIIVLDPVNRAVIERALGEGVRNYVGGNCTVSLMLMALHGLFREGWVEWLSAMTYQAASGAGARNMRELVEQMHAIGADAEGLLDDAASTALDMDARVRATLASDEFPSESFGVPLAASLIAWIDSKMETGETREEWKGFVECNKIIGSETPIPIDGICVRVGAMRCHSQAFTIKLARDVPLDEIEDVIAGANDWVTVVPNDPEATSRRLSPAAVAGRLEVPVGRLRKLRMGGDHLTAFTVGDQLLWGAAEPLRRMLGILRERTA